MRATPEDTAANTRRKQPTASRRVPLLDRLTVLVELGRGEHALVQTAAKQLTILTRELLGQSGRVAGGDYFMVGISPEMPRRKVVRRKRRLPVPRRELKDQPRAALGRNIIAELFQPRRNVMVGPAREVTLVKAQNKRYELPVGQRTGRQLTPEHFRALILLGHIRKVLLSLFLLPLQLSPSLRALRPLR